LFYKDFFFVVKPNAFALMRSQAAREVWFGLPSTNILMVTISRFGIRRPNKTAVSQIGAVKHLRWQMGNSAAMIERHYSKLTATLAADRLA
jgi:hypothetical protein